MESSLIKHTHLVNEHLERCSASLVINEMQIKTTIRPRYKVTSMIKLKTGKYQVLMNIQNI